MQRKEKTQRFSISARRIEMRAEHCCWCCCSIVRYFLSLLFRVLRLSRPYCLPMLFVVSVFHSFCIEYSMHRVESTDSGKNNAHTICNSFEGKWKISATEKLIRFWKRNNQIRIEKRIYFPTQRITEYTQSLDSDKVQKKEERKNNARNSMSRFLRSCESKQRT